MHKQRWLALLVTLIMILGLAPTALAEETITLRLWAGVQPEYGYDELVKNFNEEFKDQNVQVEYVRYVNNDEGNLQLDTYLMSGGEVDVFVSYGGMTRLMPRQEAGLVYDLTDKLVERGFDPVKEIGESNLVSGMIDGRYYAVPTKYENNLWMFVNVDMFEEAGIEVPYKGWTWAEFREAAKKLTKGEGIDKVYGLFWNLSYSFEIATDFANNYLGDYSIYKDLECTETNFDDPIYQQGLQLVLDTMLTDKSAPTYGEEVANQLTLANTFLEGKAAMAMGIAHMRLVKDTATYPHDFTTAIVPVPVPDESYLEEYWDHGNVSTGIGDTICISSKTEHIDEAVDFVIWYIKGGMAPLASGGRIPLWSGVDPQSVVEALREGAEGVFDVESVYNYLAIDKSKMVFTPNRPLTAQAEIKTVMKEELEFAMSGMKTAEQALADMKTRSDELIQEALNE